MSNQQNDPAEALRQIKARIEAATPGPWTVGSYYERTEVWGPGGAITGWGCVTQTKENGAFIAHSRTDMEVLVAVAECALEEYPVLLVQWNVWRVTDTPLAQKQAQQVRALLDALERLGQRAGEAE